MSKKMADTNYNLNDLYLKIAAWLVGHKYFFKKWWVIVMLSLDLIMIIYIAFSFIVFALASPRENQMVSQMSREFINPVFLTQNKPKDLEVSLTKALPTGSNHYDLVAKIKNPNAKWGMRTLDYTFLIDGQETVSSTGFILPGQEKYFILLNQLYQANTEPKAVEFKVARTAWQKVSDITLFNDVQFSVQEAKISLSQVTGGQASATAEAKVINDSFYDFWTVEVPIVVEVNGIPLAASKYILRQFKSLETKEVSASWQKNIPLSASLVIRPEANLFETGNFMSL
ncbi:MAG: hypothetical protein WC528_05180 [Patescibacteria group bacterium]